MRTRVSCLRRLSAAIASTMLLVLFSSAVAQTNDGRLAATPPMGWNDWAHYECNFTAQTILDNAKALVKSGLSAHGYNTVTIDDCWMLKDRDAQGNLQVDPQRFPEGMKPVAQAVHAFGLKFGIYEDAGYETCGRFAGSGEPNGGGKDHFLQDAQLFASWGVDYLKLDGCNVYVPKGSNQAAAYRKAYAAESAALKRVKRPIVFSESAPAYFQGDPDWYDVLAWVRGYGQLWREGDDVAVFETKKPNSLRFQSVLWNYSYNLPLGRFQKPGNWNDADFIIGGDDGMGIAETRSQIALWSMMSAPLILSSDLDKLNSQAGEVLSNNAIIAVDQDPLGKMANLVQRNSVMDVLFKELSGGDYAIAVLNRGTMSLQAKLTPADFGFSANDECRFDVRNLWEGTHLGSTSTLQSDIASHDTMVWRIHPASSCGMPTRTGTIIMVAPGPHDNMNGYSHCLSSTGRVEDCAVSSEDTWTVANDGALKSAGKCLAVTNGRPAMQACVSSVAQHWKYTLVGNLVSAAGQCLTAGGTNNQSQGLSLQTCSHNSPDQIWSLPN